MDSVLTKKRPAVTFDRAAMHAALCEGLGISLGHGSQTAVIRQLGAQQQWYNRVVNGGGGIDQVSEWCAIAGVRITIENNHATFEVDATLDRTPPPADS